MGNSGYERGQWDAFDRVLRWINEQEDAALPKTCLYEAVMAMRPKEPSDGDNA